MKDFLWMEEYRPHKIEDCILPDNIKDSFRGFISKGEIPNLLLSGSAGVGKTTIAKAVCDEIGAPYIVVNGSDEGRFLDTVRSRVKEFASTSSLVSTASHKVVIIDEADNTTQDVQLSLRAAIEEFHSNCRFIFTCNFPNRIIDPLHSRCTVINFKIPQEQVQTIQGKFFVRLGNILKDEEVEYDPRILAQMVQRYYPDWRRLINETQRFSVNGKLDSSVLVEIKEVNIDNLIDALKGKKYTVVEKWVIDNVSNDPVSIIRKIYDSLSQCMVASFKPQAVMILANYSRDIERVPDQELHLLACLTEIMYQCEFK